MGNKLVYVAENEKGMMRWIVALSVVVPVVVAILLFSPEKLGGGADWVYVLPHLNAVINSVASVALVAGVLFIKRGNERMHKASMTVAFLLGAVFLVSYVIYHASAESTSFGGEGWIRPVYYFLLLSHIVFAAVALFPILLAYYYGYVRKLDKHRKISKFAFPIWLYVTVTGVLVYLMISPYYVN